MRIRLWNSFASNNSGTYVLVGAFESAETAAAVATELARVAEEHGRWLAEVRDVRRGARSPLGRFVQAQGLTASPDEGVGGDDWPEYGDQPSVEALGHQVLFFVPYTVTMPRVFGEFIYRRGGRVATEIDHAHHPIVAWFTLWHPDGWRADNEAEWCRRRDGFMGAVGGVCEAALRSQDPGAPSVVPLHVAEGEWRCLEVGAVFADFPAGVRAIRDLAAASRLACTVRVAEALQARGDPFTGLRGTSRPPGA